MNGEEDEQLYLEIAHGEHGQHEEKPTQDGITSPLAGPGAQVELDA